ncbi:MAG: DUF5667 domain-containing protein [Candidatus Spechtbacterales bacterium]
MKKLIIFAAVFGLLAGGIGASAQTENLPEPGILPDSPFYLLTRFSEGIGMLFTFGDTAKAGKHLERAEKRLAEANALADQNKEKGLDKAMSLYQEHLNKALQKAEQAGNEDVIARVAEATSKHLAILEDVLERVPEQAQDAIERAMTASQRGQEAALDALSEQNPTRADEMRQRFQRDLPEEADRVPEDTTPEDAVPEIDARP